MKISLGTVQFGLDYGISNSHGVPSDAELQHILAVAETARIRNLDTAAAYGNAEERLGNFASGRFHIISKFPKVATAGELESVLNTSLKRLQTESMYGYLAHNADVLIENPSLWKVLQQAKADGKIHKTGFSLYTPQQLEQLISLGCIPDLVQLPYSILDRKFESSLATLKNLGTEIHVRSVFLQGLYFMDPQRLPEKLQPLQMPLDQFHGLCKNAGVSAAETALNYAIANPNIDQVVLGVATAAQLEENMKMVQDWQPNRELFSRIEAIQIPDPTLLNPVNWS